MENEYLSELKELAQNAINGETSALKAFTIVSACEKELSEIKANLLESAISDFEKYGAKSVKEFGFEISKSASGRYNYTNSSDWNRLKTQMQELETKMQAACKNNATIINNETGEIIEPAIFMPNKESLTIKKAK